MNENEIIEKGINFLIAGEFYKAKEYFLYNYSINKTGKLRHFIIISVLLSGNIEETAALIKEFIPENSSNRSFITMNSFLNKNKNIMSKTSDYKRLIIMAIMLKKKGYMTEARDYIKVSHLIHPADSDPNVRLSVTSSDWKSDALSGEILLYERKYKEGIECFIKASKQKK